MSEKKDIASRNLKNALFLAAIIGLFVWWVYTDIGRAANVMLALIGLGAVIFVHEFGHFIAGKLSDINVEVFALGFGPVVFGVKKLENYLQFRVLPTILVKSDDDDKGLLCFKLPVSCKAGETEYQLRIFPVGGFVKLLGQEDIGADKPSDDPRSFLNKAIWKRVLVAASGVAFNVILAIVFFIVVFTIGIRMSPAIIGGCLPGFPAEKAGLKAGDEIIEIDGKANPDFRGVALIAAFSGKNEPVGLKVKRTDGIVENLAVIAEDMPGMGFKGFGITPAGALEIAKVENPEDLFERTGLKTDDVLTAVGEDKVEQFWQYRAAMQNLFEPNVTLTFQRVGQTEPVVKNFELIFAPALKYEEEGNFVPANIYGLMPRLKIISIELPETNEVLQKGDIIVRAAEAANPTYKELRQTTTAYVEKELSITVLRNNELVETKVIPKKEPNGRAVIGIGVGLDVENPIVAETADKNMVTLPALLILAKQWLAGADVNTVSLSANLPRGAEIVNIAGKKVENYFDIAAALEAKKGKTVKITCKSALNYEQFNLTVPAEGNFIQVKAELLQELPFKPLSRLYRASGPADAIKMGFRKTVEFIAQTYMTLKGLIIGNVSPKSLMGPVGMIAASSKIIAEKEFMQYLHFMGIISACLAVMNFLPLPILDGGLVAMLIIEKIKGSPVHTKVQEWLTYAGLAIIGALFVLITYNDIIRVFFNR